MEDIQERCLPGLSRRESRGSVIPVKASPSRVERTEDGRVQSPPENRNRYCNSLCFEVQPSSSWFVMIILSDRDIRFNHTFLTQTFLCPCPDISAHNQLRNDSLFTFFCRDLMLKEWAEREKTEVGNRYHQILTHTSQSGWSSLLPSDLIQPKIGIVD